MKKLFRLRAIACFVAAVLVSGIVCAQTPAKAPIASPRDSVSGKIGSASVAINYGSPSVKGRKIWGGLVPYDKVWRTGANQATTFETNKPIKVEGKTLPAGKYSLFTKPGEKEWKIIFNAQLGEWGIKNGGEANDDPAKDVLVVSVTPVKSAGFNERLKFDVTGNGFVLRWENLEVPVSAK
jgi:hypothetical protein